MGESGSVAGLGRSGRLTAAAPDPDQHSGRSLAAEDAGISGGAATAEEAAMHDIPEDEILDLDDPEHAVGTDPRERLEGPEVRLRDEEVDPASGTTAI